MKMDFPSSDSISLLTEIYKSNLDFVYCQQYRSEAMKANAMLLPGVAHKIILILFLSSSAAPLCNSL